MIRAMIETMHRATAELIASGANQRAIKAGDKMPVFTLSNAESHKVSSADFLAKGPLVVSFYRGVWCLHATWSYEHYRKRCRSSRRST